MEYSDERHIEVDKLVEEYQNGNSESAMILLEYFELYLNKYLKILKKNSINLSDRDSRSFISLFIDDYTIRNGLKKPYQSTAVRRGAYKAASMLYSMCSSIPEEDLLQELRCALLTLARRYEKQGSKKNFSGYVYNAFKFQIHRQISEITIDPIVHACDLNLSFDEEICLEKSEDIEKEIEDMHMERSSSLKMIDEDELGPRWESGLTCGEEFRELTPNQRIIIKMKYDEGKSDLDIAEKIGLHRNTIRRQREEGIKNIKYEG